MYAVSSIFSTLLVLWCYPIWQISGCYDCPVVASLMREFLQQKIDREVGIVSGTPCVIIIAETNYSFDMYRLQKIGIKNYFPGRVVALLYISCTNYTRVFQSLQRKNSSVLNTEKASQNTLFGENIQCNPNLIIEVLKIIQVVRYSIQRFHLSL